jgi:autotransporter-associated beta strand protein
MRLPAIAFLVAVNAIPAAAAVFVSEPTAIRNGWSTFPVLTRGDSVPLLGGTTGQTFTWTASHRLWDGLGAMQADDDTIRVYVNCETAPGSIARVNLDRNGLRTWIAGRVVGNTNTNQVAAPTGLVQGMAAGWGTLGAGDGVLWRPCAANLWEPDAFGYGRGFHDRLYLTGEETFDDPPSGHFWAIDPATDTLYEAVDVGGGGSWESATLVDTGRTDTIALLLGEDRGEDPAGTALMSLYVGRKDPTGSFLERNGLAGGTTYYWDADGTSYSVGTLQGTLFTGNAVGATGTWTTDQTEAVRFSKAEDVHTDMQTTSAGFGTRAAFASQGQGVFLVDFSQVDFVAGDLGSDRQSEVSVLFAAGTDGGDGSGATGLFTAMDNLVWSPDGSVYVNEDDGEGDIWQIRVADLLADYAAGDLTPNSDAVFQILDADSIAGLGINESSGIIDISTLVGYVPGSVFLTNGMGGVADQLAMLVSPTATLAPAVTTIDVTTGSLGQRQAGHPFLTGTTPVAKAGAGMLVLDQINTLSGSFTVQAGTVEVAHARALESARLVPLAGGTAAIDAGLSAAVAGLDPLAGGLLDVGSGMLTVAEGLPQADLLTAIRSGRGPGTWAGAAGITSSAAAAAAVGTRAVGWMANDDGSLTIGYAAAGDTNLDWTVDLLDATNLLGGGRLDTGAAATWQEGDFNADELVDILDVAAFIGTGLYETGAYAGTSAAAASLAVVPEPSAAVSIAVGSVLVATAISGRRRGRPTRTAPDRRRASRARPSRGRRAPDSR